MVSTTRWVLISVQAQRRANGMRWSYQCKNPFVQGMAVVSQGSSNEDRMSGAVTETSYSRLVAMAGRQRMLSHQAALALMLAATSFETPDTFARHMDHFSNVLDAFRVAQNQIKDTVSNTQERRTLFCQTYEKLSAGRDSVVSDIEAFIKTGQSLSDVSGRKPGEFMLMAQEFSTSVVERLLPSLEAVVSAIQADSDVFLARQQEARDADANVIRKSVDNILAAAAFSRMVALNAKISAARAGEFGAEFSALTNEIKDVSERISNSSEEIRSRLLG